MGSEIDTVRNEYKNIVVSNDHNALYQEAYECFGWQTCGTRSNLLGERLWTISMWRDLKIKNRAELVKLERQFEDCTEEIAQFERGKKRTAAWITAVVCLIGAALFVGGIFALIIGWSAPMIVLADFLFMLSCLVFAAAVFVYRNRVRSRTEADLAFIDKKYEEITALMKQGRALL